MSDQDIPSGLEEDFDWQGAEDLTEFSEDELRVRLAELVREERSVSYRRRILQGRIDLIRSEFLRRGSGGLSPEALARVLMEGRSNRDSEESG